MGKSYARGTHGLSTCKPAMRPSLQALLCRCFRWKQEATLYGLPWASNRTYDFLREVFRTTDCSVTLSSERIMAFSAS